jgi:uncharacterized membrane protein
MRVVNGKLAWDRLFRAASYARSALWIVPFVAIVLVMIVAPVLLALDRHLDWTLLRLAADGARALYQTVITLTLSLIVFTFGSLLVAIQVAGGQLTPRVIATTLLRNNVVRYSVGLFVFTLIIATSALNHADANVDQLVAFAIAILALACMATFLFLIDYTARLLRPVSIVARLGEEGLAVIESVYPNLTATGPDVAGAAPVIKGSLRRVVEHHGRSGIVLAVDIATLVNEARRTDGLIEFAPQVGDFVATGEPLFALYGGAAICDDRVLQGTVALGSERTLEQDPLFAFRILVDIALKALSPAINDPSTAVLAIDQLHRLLRAAGNRRLRGEEIADEAGRRRVILRTPNWEDFVHIACHEIRMCGAGSAQIARRMRAMLEDLTVSLPAHRHAALRREMELLDRTLPGLYPLPEDLALARVPDPQGLGGSSGTRWWRVRTD